MARGYRLAAILAFVVVALTTAAGWHRGHPAANPVSLSQVATSPSRHPTPHVTVGQNSPAVTPPSLRPTPQVAVSQNPVLSPRARRSCPATAAACVDLSDHLTWLQSGSQVTYGPVAMEPGPPGTRHATPRGTFHVQWKAGPSYISTLYHEPMPYPVFFAPGGIAFHGGSLTLPSHGCVHLDIGSARYYNQHLPIGAEVVVF